VFDLCSDEIDLEPLVERDPEEHSRAKVSESGG
jgi:hypothetical protein